MLEPDGTGLSVLLWLCGLGLIAHFAFYGHQVGGRAWKHMLGRAGAVIASALVLILAAVTSLNVHYGWYATWGDVASDFTGSTPKIIEKTYGNGVSAAERKKELTKGKATDDKANAQYAKQRAAFEKSLHLTPSTTGEWVRLTVPGINVHAKDVGRVMVWLPPSYQKDSNKTYPVIEAFHGMPGGTLDYERVFHLDAAYRKAEDQHKVRDAIIVVPQAMPGGIDSECVNGGGLNMETWLTKNVPDYITQHLRVQTSRQAWLSFGVSAGGWCAAMAGLLHPDRYAGIISLGGYFKPDFSAWNPFGNNIPARYDLIQQVQKHPTDQAIWLLISGADKISGASSKEFAKAVHSPNTLTTLDYPHAGHRTSVWMKAFGDVFSWVGKTFPAFAAS